VLKSSDIDTTIPSMTDMDQLEENLKAMTGGFTRSDETLLARQLERIAPLYCRMCGQCDGACAKGCRSPTSCAASLTRMDTGSFRSAGSDSWNCRLR
jgi:MinD superfamily P-loop ATPase